jgi:hypothetical protein
MYCTNVDLLPEQTIARLVTSFLPYLISSPARSPSEVLSLTFTPEIEKNREGETRSRGKDAINEFSGGLGVRT